MAVKMPGDRRYRYGKYGGHVPVYLASAQFLIWQHILKIKHWLIVTTTNHSFVNFPTQTHLESRIAKLVGKKLEGGGADLKLKWHDTMPLSVTLPFSYIYVGVCVYAHARTMAL